MTDAMTSISNDPMLARYDGPSPALEIARERGLRCTQRVRRTGRAVNIKLALQQLIHGDVQRERRRRRALQAQRHVVVETPSTVAEQLELGAAEFFALQVAGHAGHASTSAKAAYTSGS